MVGLGLGWFGLPNVYSSPTLLGLSLGRVIGGCVIGGRVIGGCVIGGRVIGGCVYWWLCFIGGRVIGGCVNGGRAIGGQVIGGMVIGGRDMGGWLSVVVLCLWWLWLPYTGKVTFHGQGHL